MMSVKKMVETYVRFECSEETWNMMYMMQCHDLISYDNWTKFYNKCKGWYVTEDGTGIRDSENNDNLVYARDAEGFFTAVKM